MQSKQMAECLQNLAPLLEGASAEVLLRTADAVGPEAAKSFSAMATKLGKRLTESGLRPSKNPASELLDRLAKIGRIGGANTLSKDLAAAARIIELVEPLGSAQIPDAIAAALAPPPKEAKAPKAASVDPRDAADRLTDMTLDSARFDELVKQLSKISKANLAKVAQYYLGYPDKYKSKAEIIQAIRSRQLQDVLDVRREERGSKISV